MELKLNKKPKNPIIIEGFPGFGFVGAIATQFLIEHLGAKQIGSIYSKEMMPLVAIHKNQILDPLSIFYDSKHNIVLLQALTNVNGLEWKIAEIVGKLYKDLNAKELICLEGVGGLPGKKTNSKAYYQTNTVKNKARLEKLGLQSLNEGIILGVTGGILLKNIPCSCIFVEASMGLPDSRAAAKLIEILDSYLGLKVDYKPLLKKAQEFENKIKTLMTKGKQVMAEKDKKDLNYLG